MNNQPTPPATAQAGPVGSAGTNPYVGPRAFEEQDRDRFYGRNRESSQLASLIIAERVVLFYAQSGAGYHNPVETAHQAWRDAGQAPQKLLRGDQLAEAQAYAKTHPRDVTEEEQAFLVQSARQDEAEREAARRRRTILIAGAIIIIVLTLLSLWAVRSAAEARRQEAAAEAQKAVAEAERATAEVAKEEALNNAAEARRQEAIAVTAEAVAVTEREEAERQAKIALSRQLAAQAQNELNNDNPDLAFLLAIEAIKAKDTLEALIRLDTKSYAVAFFQSQSILTAKIS